MGFNSGFKGLRITQYLLGGSNQDRVVAIASRYRLEDSGFEPLSVREVFCLPHPSRSTQPTVRWVLGFLKGVKLCGRDVASRRSSILFSAEDQTVYLLSLHASMACYRDIFTFFSWDRYLSGLHSRSRRSRVLSLLLTGVVNTTYSILVSYGWNWFFIWFRDNRV